MTAPILWWKAENNAVDSVAGLVGSWRGAQQYTTGVVNNAFSFDGASSINVSNNSLFMFSPTGQFSARCYFKTANWNDTRGLIACGNDGNSWNWYLAVFNQYIILAVRGSSYTSVSQQSMSFNMWYDLLVTYNNGTWNVYFDGNSTPIFTVAGQTIDYGVVPSPSLDIGTIAASGGRLTGAIDEVRLYDQVITLDNDDVGDVLNYFVDLPQRNGNNYLSQVKKPYLISKIGHDPYFDIIEKVSRVDILYQHEQNREKKLITHLGPSFTGYASWSTDSQAGLWKKIWARAVDHDGAVIYLDREDIGDLEDLTL